MTYFGILVKGTFLKKIHNICSETQKSELISTPPVAKLSSRGSKEPIVGSDPCLLSCTNLR